MELQLVPCELDGRTLGVLALKFPRPREFTPEEQTFATAIAQQCAQALDRVRLCLAEKKARSEAEAANGAKSRFLNLVSHELRTPLNAIGGYAALMQEGIPDPVTPGQQNYLMRIQTAQRHLLSLVTNILNLARIEAGRLEYCLTEVLVQDLWSAVEQLIGVQLRVKGLEFCLTPVDPALAVIADREKALEVLLNLVGNSLKFTGRGGSIAVEAEARDDTVDLRVRDTGIGIPPERLTTIFEPFEQGEKHQTRAAEGVGLGLTISRELARGMGGELRAESTPGLGSVFTLTLPRAGRE